MTRCTSNTLVAPVGSLVAPSPPASRAPPIPRRCSPPQQCGNRPSASAVRTSRSRSLLLLVLGLLALAAVAPSVAASYEVCDADGNCYEEDSSDEEYPEYDMVIDMGEDQELFPSVHPRYADVANRYEAMKEYMTDKYVARRDGFDRKLAPVLSRCKNYDAECLMWASAGRCEQDAAFMQQACAPACHTCDSLLYERRCPYDPRAPRAWAVEEDGQVGIEGGQAGGGAVDPTLNGMFERIASDEALSKYEPKVWSRPRPAGASSPSSQHDEEGATTDAKDEAAAEASEEFAYSDDPPWVISLENFLTDAECDRLVQLGDEDGYERSDDYGEYLPDGTFKAYFIDGRTSYNAWCGACHTDDLGGKAVLAKIEEVTRIPSSHNADLQLLRYKATQHYHVHHDYDPNYVTRQPGQRILTFFLYLSDVEEGGGTNFPHLNLTFTPRKGRALIWPNVLNDDPEEWDEWTHHQALPVVRGTKFAANAWIHLHDWQGPNSRNCAE